MYDNWEQLEADNKQCKKCRLCQTRNNVVFGTGNRNADIMFIGEGPGADEDILRPGICGAVTGIEIRRIAKMQFSV